VQELEALWAFSAGGLFISFSLCLSLFSASTSAGSCLSFSLCLSLSVILHPVLPLMPPSPPPPHHLFPCSMANYTNLMYVKEDVILPQNVTFYELITNKAMGKSGPLFQFDLQVPGGGGAAGFRDLDGRVCICSGRVAAFVCKQLGRLPLCLSTCISFSAPTALHTAWHASV
jgi:hypothetical protein